MMIYRGKVKMKVELMATTQTLLREIANRRLRKKDIAKTYRLALDSSDDTDWEKVNKAIIDRWSISALKDIKDWAWSGKCFEKEEIND